MQTIGITTPFHHTAGKFVNNHNLAVFDNIIDITDMHFVCAQRLIDVMNKSGVFAVLNDANGCEVAYHRLFVERFGNLDMAAEPRIRMSCGDGKLTLCADDFVWKFCPDVNGEVKIADNAFDLFPGIPKVIPWEGEVPAEWDCGNRFVN